MNHVANKILILEIVSSRILKEILRPGTFFQSQHLRTPTTYNHNTSPNPINIITTEKQTISNGAPPMSGSNPDRSGAENPRNQDRPANRGAHRLTTTDDIRVAMSDRLPLGNSDDAERLGKERSKRAAFRRLIWMVVAKIRRNKPKPKAKG
ncbi:hypothetical protein HOY82DRAFT_597562 [Tuber indicum]|nr:hypothetical protein HOY82DRAFT_597562 [Tuber indicum]